MEREPITHESPEPDIETLQGISATEAAAMNRNQTIEDVANSPKAKQAIHLAETAMLTRYHRAHGMALDHRKYRDG